MNKPKKIVIDARIRRSGTGRYVDKLIEHLQQVDKTNKYIILLQSDDPLKIRAENFTIVQSDYKQFSVNPLEQFGFAWQIYSLKPDLVHFSMTQQPMLYFGKIVTTTHDLTMFEYTRPGKYPGWFHAIRTFLYPLLVWWSHRKSDRIIVPTKYVAKGLAEYQPFTKNKIVVTYEASGVDLQGAAKQPGDVAKPFIFHVGSPFPHKNIERLIEAFGIVKNKVPDLQLVLVGKREHYFEQLEKLAADSPVRDSILFTGFIPDNELKWLYKNASGYVLPSLSEGFGIPGLEAMSYDCPLISSKATCLPEVYGDAAHYFDPSDTKDMAKKITDVVKDKKLQKKLVSAGRKQVKKYSWQKMARQTHKTYMDLV
jgi:glycosyltransferase involved in cell wall biosynthesis